MLAILKKYSVLINLIKEQILATNVPQKIYFVKALRYYKVYSWIKITNKMLYCCKWPIPCINETVCETSPTKKKL